MTINDDRERRRVVSYRIVAIAACALAATHLARAEELALTCHLLAAASKEKATDEVRLEIRGDVVDLIDLIKVGSKVHYSNRDEDGTNYYVKVDSTSISFGSSLIDPQFDGSFDTTIDRHDGRYIATIGKVKAPFWNGKCEMSSVPLEPLMIR